MLTSARSTLPDLTRVEGNKTKKSALRLVLKPFACKKSRRPLVRTSPWSDMCRGDSCQIS